MNQEILTGDPPPRPTPAQFARAARRTRLGEASIGAAKMVLVDGLTMPTAGKLFGIRHRQQVWEAVQAIRRELVRGGACSVCGARTERHGHGQNEMTDTGEGTTHGTGIAEDEGEAAARTA